MAPLHHYLEPLHLPQSVQLAADMALFMAALQIPAAAAAAIMLD
jgi:hypothetical protein